MADTAVYIHFPFCLTKCHYCSFNSVAGQEELIPPYLEALHRELGQAGKAFFKAKDRALTVYFGGGTPSLMGPGRLQQLLGQVAQHLLLDDKTEVSLEANPGQEADWRGFRQAGVNRMSLGLQSFSDEFLKALGRAHTREQGIMAYNEIRGAGFESVGVDLIFGLPGQSLQQWERDLKSALNLSPDHISVYGLSVEEGTLFYKLKQEKRLSLPDEYLEAEMFSLAHDLLVAAGYEHYEISNYARPGHRCRHNQIYWQRGQYLGLGVGAHSFLPEAASYGIRMANEPDIGKYIASVVTQGAGLKDKEILNREEAICEVLFLSLRTSEGLALSEFESKFGPRLRERLLKGSRSLVAEGKLFHEEGRLKFSLEGMLLADELTVTLLKSLF